MQEAGPFKLVETKIFVTVQVETFYNNALVYSVLKTCQFKPMWLDEMLRRFIAMTLCASIITADFSGFL